MATVNVELPAELVAVARGGTVRHTVGCVHGFRGGACCSAIELWH
jgi:hypothetical protein